MDSLVLTLFPPCRIVDTTCTYILSGNVFEGIEAGRIQKWRIPLAAGKRYDARWIEWRGRVHRSTVKMLEFTGYIHLSFRSCSAACIVGLCRPTLLRMSHENLSILHELWFANLPIYLLYLVQRPAECDAKNSFNSLVSDGPAYKKIWLLIVAQLFMVICIYGLIRDFCSSTYWYFWLNLKLLKNTYYLFVKYWKWYFSE